MAEKCVLIVEDNDRLRKFVRSSLEKNGYRVFEAATGAVAFSILREEYLDIVLLDLHLGDIAGIDILRTIRRQDEDLPVIIVSTIQDQDVKVGGFDIGCDDYITKPFYMQELLSRMARLLKRRQGPGTKAAVEERIRSGPFEIDVRGLSVKKEGTPIEMRKKLFDLFLYFVKNEETVLSNEALFSRAWEAAEEMNENSLYVHIRALRKLVEDDPAEPRYIRTVRNAGYVYSAG